MDDETDQAQPPSIEPVQETEGQEVIYSRTNGRSRATGPETRGAEAEPEPDLRADCQKYLKMILNDVGEDDGERQPMNIVVIGKFYIFCCTDINFA